MNKTLFFLFLLISVLLKAQSSSALDENFDFVNYQENYIHFYDNESNLDAFLKKLDSLIVYKKGKVRILQIGGSHIQAEVWPDQVRKKFIDLTENMNGGRGFVFPFKIAGTWNPKNKQITYTGDWETYRNSVKKQQSTWGLSGITVSTKDTLCNFSICYRHDSITNYTFNKVKIFHEIGVNSFDVDLISDEILSKETYSELGYTEFILARATDSLYVEIRKTDSIQKQFNLYGLSLDNDQPGIIYTSLGVNGAKTSSFLRNKLFKKQLETVQPDLVIFCLGINDAYYPNFCETCYKENYLELVSWVKSVNPNANFIFVTNNDSYYKQKYANPNVLKAREVMMDLAKKNHAGLWDLFKVMGGLNSVKKWEEEGYAKKDKIHFTNQGYQLIGDLFFNALMNQYSNYIKNKH